MRQITELMSSAFRHWRNKSMSNTIVKYDDKWRTTSMYLHWNLIAVLYDDWTLELDTCGWMSNTTKERMNGILEEFGLWRIRQVKGDWFLVKKNGEVVDFDKKMILSIYDN